MMAAGEFEKMGWQVTAVKTTSTSTTTTTSTTTLTTASTVKTTTSPPATIEEALLNMEHATDILNKTLQEIQGKFDESDASIQKPYAAAINMHSSSCGGYN